MHTSLVLVFKLAMAAVAICHIFSFLMLPGTNHSRGPISRLPGLDIADIGQSSQHTGIRKDAYALGHMLVDMHAFHRRTPGNQPAKNEAMHDSLPLDTDDTSRTVSTNARARMGETNSIETVSLELEQSGPDLNRLRSAPARLTSAPAGPVLPCGKLVRQVSWYPSLRL